MKRLFAAAALISLLAGPASLALSASEGQAAPAEAPSCAADHQIAAVIKMNKNEGWKIVKLTEPQRAAVEESYNRNDPPTNEHFDAIYIAKRKDAVDNEGNPLVLVVLVQHGCFVGAIPLPAKVLETILERHQS